MPNNDDLLNLLSQVMMSKRPQAQYQHGVGNQMLRQASQGARIGPPIDEDEEERRRMMMRQKLMGDEGGVLQLLQRLSGGL